MMRRACAFEDAVLSDALDTTRATADDLVAHLDACEGCRDLHAIASALHDDHAVALAEAHVPSAGQVWWRAELRARQEATTLAARPITVATGIAAAAIIGLLASLTGALAWWLQDSPAFTLRATADKPITGSAMEAVANLLLGAAGGEFTGLRLVIWLCAGAMLIATPVLLYMAFRDE